MHILGEFLGYLAGVCVAVAFLPQSLKTIKDKNVKGLSLASYIIYCTGIAAWVLYGFYLHSVQMVVFNAISLIFAGIILYMIVRYQKKS
ncbi:MAG: SemiSWEET transporter [Alphaproteobacteria bacterium]|nr:SemiSWEET transporter [Alphaproteobacteria bacterium]